MDDCGPLESYLKKKKKKDMAGLEGGGGKKGDPFGGKKGGKKLDGPDGVKKSDQYAKTSGRKIVEDEKDFSESEQTGKKGIASIKSGGGKKKQRTYLDV